MTVVGLTTNDARELGKHGKWSLVWLLNKEEEITIAQIAFVDEVSAWLKLSNNMGGKYLVMEKYIHEANLYLISVSMYLFSGAVLQA